MKVTNTFTINLKIKLTLSYVYVNDLLICSSNIHFVNNMKSLLCNKFNMNDLRESVILGIKSTRLEKGSSMD